MLASINVNNFIVCIQTEDICYVCEFFTSLIELKGSSSTFVLVLSAEKEFAIFGKQIALEFSCSIDFIVLTVLRSFDGSEPVQQVTFTLA